MESDSDIFSDDDSSQDHVQNKGNFHGCYLLISKNPKFIKKPYIGYTVNPNRRIKQHNGGQHMGGAKKTSGRGPWEMVLIVHGFPNEIAALRFEWAWQNPAKSRHIGPSVSTHKYKEPPLNYKLRVLAHMLNVPPWLRLPLTIRWLKPEYEVQFHPQKQPPVHMPIAYGLVDIQPMTAVQSDSNASGDNEEPKNAECGMRCKINKFCYNVSRMVENEHPLLRKCLHSRVLDSSNWLSAADDSTTSVLLSCYHKDCSLTAHVTCLAKEFCEDNQLIPVSGACPLCKQNLLWGELVRRHQQEKIVAQSTQIEEEEASQPSKPRNARGRYKKKKKVPTQKKKHWSEELHIEQ